MPRVSPPASLVSLSASYSLLPLCDCSYLFLSDLTLIFASHFLFPSFLTSLLPSAPGPGPCEKGLDTSPSGPPNVMLNSTTLGTGDSKDVSLEAGPGPPGLLAHPETADTDGGLESPLGRWDCSSVTSFVTAVEASGAEDLTGHTSPWAGVRLSQRVPRSLGTLQLAHQPLLEDREAELNAAEYKGINDTLSETPTQPLKTAQMSIYRKGFRK